MLQEFLIVRSSYYTNRIWREVFSFRRLIMVISYFLSFWNLDVPSWIRKCFPMFEIIFPHTLHSTFSFLCPSSWVFLCTFKCLAEVNLFPHSPHLNGRFDSSFIAEKFDFDQILFQKNSRKWVFWWVLRARDRLNVLPPPIAAQLSESKIWWFIYRRITRTHLA